MTWDTVGNAVPLTSVVTESSNRSGLIPDAWGTK